ncbi:MAG: NAD(P)H-hydrate dehydratase [Saprospiraceae bacterium]|nr:NAD(P)H-hydrate dehydratase [Saprospiraceae bacterium]
MLPVYKSATIKQWDVYTIENEPISSVELMDRAASVCVEWLRSQYPPSTPVLIFCGNGNNGGDGLSIGMQLQNLAYRVSVCLVPVSAENSRDYEIQLAGVLNNRHISILQIDDAKSLLKKNYNTLVIDAILGSGTNRSPSPELENIFEFLQPYDQRIVSIDLPSGMYPDQPPGHLCVHASATLSLQTPKLTSLLPQTGKHYGLLKILDIGLMPDFVDSHPPDKWFIRQEDVVRFLKRRKPFDYKNNFGHVCMVGSCLGMAGALVLSAKAALKSGCGLCTLSSVSENRIILQTSVPEAMFCSPDQILPEKFKVLAIGPGMGKSESMKDLLYVLKDRYAGIWVIDADALNLISEENVLDEFKGDVVITPHVGEFDRLFGPSENDFQRLEKAIDQAVQLKITIVLKGHHTATVTPDGKVYFNSSGNPGLAKGGSGDVLTGMIAAFLAQGYSTREACIIAVYLHGFAADLLAEKIAIESMMATDLLEVLPLAMKNLFQHEKSRSPFGSRN